MLRDLLQRDPEFRPSAAELLLSKLPGLTVERDIRYSLDIWISRYCRYLDIIDI